MKAGAKRAICAAGILGALLLLRVLAAGWALTGFDSSSEPREVYRQSAQDGSYTLVIRELGDPDWSFGAAHYEVELTSDESRFKETTFRVDVGDDGGHGRFQVVWREDEVEITFSGKHQEDAVYVLPFGRET